MSVEENKEVVRRQLEEVFNRGRGSSAVAEFWTEDASSNQGPQGRENLGRHIDMLLAAHPGWRFEIHELIGEGDKVVARLTAHATYAKPVPGLEDIPAVGQPLEREQVNIFTLRGGLIDHLHVVADMGAMRRMLAAGATAASPR